MARSKQRTKIDEYCEMKGITLSELAEQIPDMTASRLSQIKRGAVKNVSRDDAFAIEKATNFYVSAKECPGVAKTDAAVPAKSN